MYCGFFLELLRDAHWGRDGVAQITVSYLFGTNSSQDNRVLEIAQSDILNIKRLKQIPTIQTNLLVKLSQKNKD